MNDIHIRAILLMVIGAISIGGAVGGRLVTSPDSIGPGILFLIGAAALGLAIYILLFAQEVETE
jgi:hypothetical protein